MRRAFPVIVLFGLGLAFATSSCSNNPPGEKPAFSDGGTPGSGGNVAASGTSLGGAANASQGGSGSAVTSAGGNGATSSISGTASSSANVGGSNAGGNNSGGSSGTGSSRGGATQSSLGGGTSGGMATVGGGTNRGGAGGGSGSIIGGSTAAGGMVATGGLWRGPTPATAKSNFPFPQNRQSPNCTYPKEYKNEDVKSVYEKWKADLVTADGAGGFRRVKRPDEPGLEKNSTVSEGIAYGMIIAVYMDDQPLFDDLWKYSLAHSWSYTPYGGGAAKPTLLMNWYISSSGGLGSNPSGSGAATDADEDMAWALVMADKQWGGQGTLSKSYLDYAKQMIGDIWNYEILDGKLPKNGSGWGDWNNLNVSYFAPSYYRVFAKVSGNAAWNDGVVKCSYDTIEGNLTAANGNQSNGLVPAFSTSTGGNAVQTDPGASPLRHDYQYDSCRTPFRIGLDACMFNDSRAKAYVAKTSQFFAAIGAANIKDGYTLSGSPTPEWGSRGFAGRSAAFIGPAGVGAMHSSTYQTFINEVWDLTRQNNMWCGGQYYDESWTMLTLLMMSGNFLDYTVETPK